MDKLLITLSEILIYIKNFFYKTYKKASFMFSKQLTLQKMYEPLKENRIKIIEELSLKLTILKKENNSLTKRIEKLEVENSLLKDKLSAIQELLLKK
ncbi:hypothetical protein NBE98_20330 [Clostridium swellfunianum]|uniref:hypothetical protein n=1 Tax=Clostridium swellfunianum TaxID=1367462 RepID=UPI00202F19E8|nr:hypothetical protein [Clostridium swellfunianum]MCM0650714.1 hypothetical protein [Clostridium swellfunianum]